MLLVLRYNDQNFLNHPLLVRKDYISMASDGFTLRVFIALRGWKREDYTPEIVHVAPKDLEAGNETKVAFNLLGLFFSFAHPQRFGVEVPVVQRIEVVNSRVPKISDSLQLPTFSSFLTISGLFRYWNLDYYGTVREFRDRCSKPEFFGNWAQQQLMGYQVIGDLLWGPAKTMQQYCAYYKVPHWETTFDSIFPLN
jgi:hypothetical protein